MYNRCTTTHDSMDRARLFSQCKVMIAVAVYTRDTAPYVHMQVKMAMQMFY